MSDPPADATELELENFRRRWREEVSARSSTRNRPGDIGTSAARSRPDTGKDRIAGLANSRPHAANHDELDGLTYHDLPDQEEQLKVGAAEKGFSRDEAFEKEPRTALEHYEKAVESEAAGQLGESVKLYRRAFKVCFTISKKRVTTNKFSLTTECMKSTRTNTFRLLQTHLNQHNRTLQMQQPLLLAPPITPYMALALI